jgi:hypothetical protein
VPVQLSQRSRLECHDRRRNGFRHGEIPRVYNLDRAAASCCLLRLDFAGAENVGAVAFEFAERRVDAAGCEVGFQDVGVWGGDGV